MNRNGNLDEALIAALRADRPWRRLGAGICVVAGVMFACGIVFLPEKPAPFSFALFWLIELGLLGWVCLLALKDVRHTIRLLREHRRAVATVIRDADGEDQDA